MYIALHVLQRTAPILPVLPDINFQHSERVVDPVMARKWFSLVRQFKDGNHFHLVQVGLHI